jgi:MFS family permease
MLLLVAVASLFGMSFVTQTPIIAAQSSDNPQAFLLLVSAGGLGSLIGIAFVSGNIGRVAKVSSASLILGTLGFLVVALGWSHSLVLSAVIAAAAGAMQFAVTTIASVAVQTQVDDFYRGRVSSMLNVAWGGFVPIGGLLLGAMVALFGLAGGMTLSGIFTIIGAVGAYTLWIVQRRRKNLDD